MLKLMRDYLALDPPGTKVRLDEGRERRRGRVAAACL